MAETPVAPEPVVVDTPVAPEPVVETPAGPEPVVDAPVAPEPVVETPVGPEPVVEAPVAPEPVVETAVGPEPAVVETPVYHDPLLDGDAVDAFRLSTFNSLQNNLDDEALLNM